MSAPRSIALYVPSLGAGGAERSAALLASGFQAAGLATTLLVDHDADENRALVHREVRLVALAGRHDRDVVRLAAWLARERPDVALAIDAAASAKLVSAKLVASATLAAGRLLPRPPTRIFLSYHGYFPIVRGRLGRAAYRLAPVLARLSERTVCVSQGLARHLVETWGAPAERVVSIPNPVAVERALPAADRAALGRRPPHILAVGRLVPEKGFADLIAALTECPPETRLTILGEGPERPALERAAAAFGGRVALPGYADPWRALEVARVFALNSTSEAFGNVVVEALAAGLPVVATDCGGPGEILDHGRHGRLVPPGNRRALAAALREALADPGDPAPRRARAAAFTTERVVGDYLALFSGALPARRD